MPSGKTGQPEIVDNKDGTVTVKYAPTETGLHEMHIKYNGAHIPGESVRECKDMCAKVHLKLGSMHKEHAALPRRGSVSSSIINSLSAFCPSWLRRKWESKSFTFHAEKNCKYGS